MRPHKNEAPGIATYRDDFPAFAEKVNGKPLAYLDTAASAQKPLAVIEKVREAMSYHYANIHRGLYHFSQVTTQEYEAVRPKAAALIGAPSAEEIVFTRNATEGVNLVAQSWGRANLKPGDEIILSVMEHHANLVPWQILSEQTGVRLRFAPILDDGTLDMEQFEGLFSEKTRLLTIVHVSNALGTVNPVAKLVKIAKNYNPDIRVLIDGSQSAVHGPVDISKMGCDFFVLTGHKLYGPTGSGVLWGKRELLDTMPPYQGGGDMIEAVTLEGSTFKPAPARFEAGTPDFVAAIGLGAAIDYVQAIGMDAIAAHEQAMLAYARPKLEEVGGLTFYGTGPDKAGILSFTAGWGHPSDIAMILDKCGVAVRSGHHCCMPLMKRLGVEATVRASFGLYTNKDDIDALAAGLRKAREMLG